VAAAPLSDGGYLKWKRPPGLPGAAVAMKFDFDGSEMAA